MSDVESVESLEEEREKLSSFITFASAALQSRRPDPPAVAKDHSNQTLRILQHVTTLLNTGNIHRNNSSRTITITANVRRQFIDVLIVASEDAGEKASSWPISLKQLIPTASGKEFLKRWSEPELEYALLNTFSLIRTKYIEATEARIDHTNCYLYIINHAFRKIAARILKGGQIWEKHPMDTLAGYGVSDLCERLSLPKAIEASDIIHGWLRDHYNVLPLDQGTPAASSRYATYLVTADTVGQWIKALTNTFASLRGVFVTDENCIKEPAENERRCVEGLKHLLIFQALLRCHILDFLLSDGTLAAKMGMKPFGQVKAADLGRFGPGGEATNEDEDHVFADDLMSATSRNPIIHYLNSIVAWPAAVECLQVVGKSIPLPIRAHIITVPHSVASTTDGLATEFKARILKDTRLRHLDQALLSTALDDRLRNRSEESTIHAEAVMMTLSRSFSWTDVSKESQMQLGIDENGRNKLLDMFQAEQTPIAVSKRCCWCCWQLYQYYQPAYLRHPPGVCPPPKLLLFGTHSTIHQWSPPHFGVPIDFLRKLAYGLERILVDNLKEEAELDSDNPEPSSPDDFFLCTTLDDLDKFLEDCEE
ncbi:uncharacterized protein STEHIDRAFT_159267 [Stereum hirsutum FP-91666 SS1]|uniref:uncharacterized protein n=1 Tax=Stereum hirsutum (strain FP-91666) TaxID=721885 RepID=UPI000444A4E2|nr:uncharacterized protein STEHIDRAFT_159267 [Stereum hirsutum FP-91666 SS1]EIM84602.1 hypothetical protein STEHIDRAFT_159267 [Stereum hirsutum FP-91666 SS1]